MTPISPDASGGETPPRSVWTKLNRPLVVTVLGGSLVALLTYGFQGRSDSLAYIRELRLSDHQKRVEIFERFADDAFACLDVIYRYKTLNLIGATSDGSRRSRIPDFDQAYEKARSRHQAAPSITKYCIAAQAYFDSEDVGRLTEKLRQSVRAMYHAAKRQEVEQIRTEITANIYEVMSAMGRELKLSRVSRAGVVTSTLPNSLVFNGR